MEYLADKPIKQALACQQILDYIFWIAGCLHHYWHLSSTPFQGDTKWNRAVVVIIHLVLHTHFKPALLKHFAQEGAFPEAIMLRIFKTVNDLLVPQDHPDKDCWINLYMPTEAELTKVSEATGIPWDFLSDSLDADERARIEIEDDFLLIVLEAPIHNAGGEVPYLTVPIGIIITRDTVVTVCRSSEDLVSQLITIRPKNISTSERMSFALNVLMRSARHYLQALKELNRMTGEAEKALYKAMRNKELINLLTINKSLVYFVTSLEANEMTMNRLLHSRLISLNEQESDILEDALTENRQAIGMAKVYSSILSGMSDAFASIISNNMNTVMKMLTGVTIILMIPNIITSVYGMNIELPLAASRFAFAGIMGATLILCVLVWTLFIKKRWL